MSLMNLFFIGLKKSLTPSPFTVITLGNSYSGQLSTHIFALLALSLPNESTAVMA
jgi:hypothetical protein